MIVLDLKSEPTCKAESLQICSFNPELGLLVWMIMRLYSQYDCLDNVQSTSYYSSI